MVATMGETTGACALAGMKKRMAESVTGARILAAQPRITTASIRLERLRGLPAGTLGREYARFRFRLRHQESSLL